MSAGDFEEIRAYSQGKERARKAEGKAREDRLGRWLTDGKLSGWKRFGQHHFQYVLQGDILDYWPSTNRWRWRNKTNFGSWDKLVLFIWKREHTE